MKKAVFVDAGKESDKPAQVKDNRRISGLNLIVTLIFLSAIGLSIYLVFRSAAFFNPGYSWIDRVFAAFLLGAESFLAVHAFGFLLSVLKASRKYQVREEHFFVGTDNPPVGVIVASYNEDPAVLEETLASVANLDYPEKRLYLLDDSTDEKIRARLESLAGKYQFTYLHRKNRRGYKAGAINDLLKQTKESYIAVFDADQKPVPDFLDVPISMLESNDNLAFIQTPQYYSNIDENAVAFGASYQQVVFYEYICEGKSVSNAMFSCGSNIVYRVAALQSINGFDEISVTEDFATGFRLHMSNWKSIYYNFVYVYGIGPESLAGYFTQQMRWALGTLGLFKKVAALFIRKPKALKIGQWWEYTLSGTYYWIGWANFILIICPVAFLLGDVRPLIANPVFYIAAFLPYFLFALSTFYYSMWRRGYKLKYLVIGQSLGLNSFWVLMNAAIMALFNIKKPFGVTPKGASGSLNIIYLWPQILLIIASLAAMVMGVYKVMIGYGAALLINVLWAGYHVALLSMIFYFNRTFKPYEPKSIFVEEEARK